MRQILVLLPSFLMSMLAASPSHAWSQSCHRAVAPDGLIEEISSVIKSADENRDDLCLRLGRFLLSPDREIGEKTYSFLLDNRKWLNLANCDALLEEYRYRNKTMTGELLSLATLQIAPRQDRLAYYRTAIENGGVRLPHGFLLKSSKAMVEAARDGAIGLRDTIHTQYAEQSEGFKTRVSLEYLDALLLLRNGGENRANAEFQGAKRLSAIETRELRQQLINDRGFFRAASETAIDSCAVNPFDGSQNEGCRFILRVYLSQRGIADAEPGIVEVDGVGSQNRGMQRPYSEWLHDLGNLRLDGKSFLEHFNDVRFK